MLKLAMRICRSVSHAEYGGGCPGRSRATGDVSGGGWYECGLIHIPIGHDCGLPANIIDRWLTPARQVARVAKGSGL